jgi:hypothetical protein
VTAKEFVMQVTAILTPTEEGGYAALHARRWSYTLKSSR